MRFGSLSQNQQSLEFGLPLVVSGSAITVTHSVHAVSGGTGWTAGQYILQNISAGVEGQLLILCGGPHSGVPNYVSISQGGNIILNTYYYGPADIFIYDHSNNVNSQMSAAAFIYMNGNWREISRQSKIGPEGNAGNPGIDGDTGPQGETGVVGNPGEAGPEGNQGDTGSEEGDTGAKGDVGEQGDIGIAGDTGPEGEPCA